MDLTRHGQIMPLMKNEKYKGVQHFSTAISKMMDVGERTDKKREVNHVFILRKTVNGKTEVHIVRVHLDSAFLKESPGGVHPFDGDGALDVQAAMQAAAACFS